MGQAILFNNNGSEDLNLINGLLEEYTSLDCTIGINTFIDFLNTTEFTVGANTVLSTNTHSGLIGHVIRPDQYDYNHDTWAAALPQNGRYWSQPIHYHQVDENTIILYYVWCATGGYCTNVVSLHIEDNVITSSTVILDDAGHNLELVSTENNLLIFVNGSWWDNTNSSAAYYLAAQAVQFNPSTYALTKCTVSRTDGYCWRCCVLSHAFKLDSHNAIVFFTSSHNTSYNYRYHEVATIHWDDNGNISWRYGNRRDKAYNENEVCYLYDSYKITDTKFALIGYSNFPHIWIVDAVEDTATNLWSFTTRDRVDLPTTTNYNSTDTIRYTHHRGNYVYVPYYTGTMWIMHCVDCSMTGPDTTKAISVAQAQIGMINRAERPLIMYLDDENCILSFQKYGNRLYATNTKILPDNSILPGPQIQLSLNKTFYDFYQIILTAPGEGYIVARDQYNTNNVDFITFTYGDRSVTLNEDNVYTITQRIPYDWNYNITRKISDKYSLFIYQPDTGYRAGMNVILLRKRGDIIDLSESIEIYRNKSNVQSAEIRILDFMPVDDDTAMIMFRDRDPANTGYSDLWIAVIHCHGTRCYVKTHKIRRSNDDARNQDYYYGKLIKFSNDKYVALYRENCNDSRLGATAFTIEPGFTVVPSNYTGRVSGITKELISPDISGKVYFYDVGDDEEFAAQEEED